MAGDTEFWTSHLEACRREGAAASVYARQHGLALASLYYWRRKLTPATVADGACGTTGKFVALRVVHAQASPANGACTLVLGSGLRLEMTAFRHRAGCWLSNKPTLEFTDASGLSHRAGIFMPRPGRLP